MRVCGWEVWWDHAEGLHAAVRRGRRRWIPFDTLHHLHAAERIGMGGRLCMRCGAVPALGDPGWGMSHEGDVSCERRATSHERGVRVSGEQCVMREEGDVSWRAASHERGEDGDVS